MSVSLREALLSKHRNLARAVRSVLLLILLGLFALFAPSALAQGSLPGSDIEFGNVNLGLPAPRPNPSQSLQWYPGLRQKRYCSHLRDWRPGLRGRLDRLHRHNHLPQYLLGHPLVYSFGDRHSLRRAPDHQYVPTLL